MVQANFDELRITYPPILFLVQIQKNAFNFLFCFFFCRNFLKINKQILFTERSIGAEVQPAKSQLLRKCKRLLQKLLHDVLIYNLPQPPSRSKPRETFRRSQSGLLARRILLANVLKKLVLNELLSSWSFIGIFHETFLNKVLRDLGKIVIRQVVFYLDALNLYIK